jgi:hypothetical protein
MNRDISRFLSVGRQFRFQQLKGDFLFIGKDPELKETIEYCMDKFGYTLKSYTCPVSTSSLSFLNPIPKCIILEEDHEDLSRTERFLASVDARIPKTIAILVTNEISVAKKFRDMFPRLTVVLKGSGFHDLLMTVLPKKFDFKRE